MHNFKRASWIFSTIIIIKCCVFVQSFSTFLNSKASSNSYLALTSDNEMKNSLIKEFQRDGGILYKKSIFSQANITALRSDMAKITLKEETASSIAKYRLGATLPRDSFAVSLLESGELMNLIHQIFGKSYCLSTEIPVEVRVYEKPGAGMEWHVDDVLYDPPQIEVVITIENTSDCETMWKSQDGSRSTCLETDINSAIVLKAGGVRHRVKPMRYGRRVILKCAYVDQHATFYKNELVKQFDSPPKKARKKQRKNRH